MISIIIPTYNRAHLLTTRAIPSILAQTVTDWECHVVGDGTDEETRAAMAGVIAGDDRFRFTNLKRQAYPEGSRWGFWGLLGLEALNHGLDTAQGDWIAVLNDDDEFTKDHHETLLTLAGRHEGVDFVYGKSVTPWGQEYGTWPPGDGALTQGSYLYRGRARDYRYDLDCLTDRALNGDADMWTRMYAGGVSFSRTGHVVHRYYPSSSRSES